jgi:hypothetical protein
MTVRVPILHYVVEHAPQLLVDFAANFPPAAHLRDVFGRKIYQTELALECDV